MSSACWMQAFDAFVAWTPCYLYKRKALSKVLTLALLSQLPGQPSSSLISCCYGDRLLCAQHCAPNRWRWALDLCCLPALDSFPDMFVFLLLPLLVSLFYVVISVNAAGLCFRTSQEPHSISDMPRDWTRWLQFPNLAYQLILARLETHIHIYLHRLLYILSGQRWIQIIVKIVFASVYSTLIDIVGLHWWFSEKI